MVQRVIKSVEQFGFGDKNPTDITPTHTPQAIEVSLVRAHTHIVETPKIRKANLVIPASSLITAPDHEKLFKFITNLRKT